ncbi:DNA-binding protein [Streptomyces sp. NPDC015184]|uniref:DNA-binding protein n=1 Tax=Streptomyces sp. NPDC015184 TaxID=3364946 RepID=UPI0036F9E840
MATKAYELYGVPTAPDHPEQEYMTVQETAYILKCSVSWLRRFLRKHPALCGRNGVRGRIITNREQRAAIHAARVAGDPRTGRPVPRQRRPRRTAVKSPAAA